MKSFISDLDLLFHITFSYLRFSLVGDHSLASQYNSFNVYSLIHLNKSFISDLDLF